jgi:hypothetical protein
MKISVLHKVASALVIAFGAIATSLPAQAGTLINGWNYARDDYSYDGTDAGNLSATSKYDIYGIGVKQVGNQIWVGVNTSTPLTGVANNAAADKNIGWGDLFLDFNYGDAGNTFATAQGSMIGIRFAATNDSSATTTGVYTNVTGKSVTGQNSGFTSLNHYSSQVSPAKIGDLAVNDAYYAPYAKANVPNSIGLLGKSSVRIGDVTALLASDLSDLPSLNLVGNNGSKFGFKFDRPLGFSGDFLGSLFLECINDSVAIQGNLKSKSVPVPPAIAGILAAAAFGGWRAAKSKKQLKAVEA